MIMNKSKIGVLLLAAVCLGYLIFLGWEDRADIFIAMTKISPPGVILVLGLSLANYLIRFGRWQWYLTHLGYQVPIPAGLQYYLAGFTFTVTPGKAGEAVRSIYLKRHGIPYARSLSAFFAERLSDVIAMLLLSCLVAFQFPQYRIPVSVVVPATLLFLLVIQQAPVLTRLQTTLTKWTGTGISKIIDQLFLLVISAARLLRVKMLFIGLALGIIAWGAEGLAFYCILRFLDIDSPVWMAISIYSISLLLGALSFLPAGLGSTEAVMVILLVLIGASHGSAIAATVICRVTTLWFAVVLGSVVMLGTPAIGTVRSANRD